MSGSSSYPTFESEDETSSWLMSSDDSIDEDELTLLNGDEESDEDSTTFEEFLKLSMRLKRQYNLRDASVALERCDKIWDTMQLLKKARTSYEDEDDAADSENTDDEDNDYEEEEDGSTEGSKSTSDSLCSNVTSNAVSYIKYQPMQGNGNNALPNFYLSVKKQRKIYNCATCGKIYSEKRAFRLHTKRDHGIALPSPPHSRKRLSSTETRITRSRNSQCGESNSGDTEREIADKNTRKNPEALYKCPMCENRYLWKISLRKHAMEVHGIDIPVGFKRQPKNDAVPRKSEAASVAQKSNPEKEVNRPNKPEGNYLYRYRWRKVYSSCVEYQYTCIVCEQHFKKKWLLRNHAHSEHGINIPETGRVGLFEEDDGKLSRQRGATTTDKTSGSSRRSRVKVSKNDVKSEGVSVAKRQRAGPKSSKVFTRPRRSCTVATSYECTKVKSESPQRGQTTRCFLCKNRFVDIKKHLRDYHRISSPDSVLPLNKVIVKPEISETIIKQEKKDTKEVANEKKTTNQPKVKRFRAINTSERFKGLYRHITDEKTGRQLVQCLMCMSKYSDRPGLRRHLIAKMVDGVVQQHESHKRDVADLQRSPKRRSLRNSSKTAADSLELSDMPDSMKSDDNETRSEKRGSSFSDVSSSTSETMPSKRRKIEISNTPDTPEEISDTRSDNYESEATTGKSPEDLRYNLREGDNEEDNDDPDDDNDDDDEEKNLNQRDTRDSSDRDSGIGISITIKKRNNSYEVVGKDNYGEEDKTQDHGDIKDDNVMSLDSSCCVTGTDFRNSDERIDSRRREFFDTLDYSEERRNPSDTTTNDKKTDDDVTIVDVTDIVVARKQGEVSDEFDRKDDRRDQEACANMPGKVPSLRLLCRNSLRRNELSRSAENHKEFSSMSGLL